MLTAIPAEDYVACYANERQRQKARARTMDWTIPSLRSLEITPPARVVSVGCGNGIDVATLRDSGYEAYGIDMHEVEPPAGSWCQMGIALDLPFGDREFDAVISLEVIEHVGLDYDGTGSAAYTRYAAELQRVLRPGGVILIATPNRFFPVDEHGGGTLQIRLHSPFRDSTFSFGEIRQLFPDCEAGTLGYEGYFRLEKLSRLYIPVDPVHFLLKVFDNRWLHRSPLNPHLFMWLRNGNSALIGGEAVCLAAFSSPFGLLPGLERASPQGQ